MRKITGALLLMLAACSAAPVSETESEDAISERAAEIRNQADADTAKQIEEIDAAANAEGADLEAAPANAQ
jgi:starvation-inducible outer membrane lipoprotein